MRYRARNSTQHSDYEPTYFSWHIPKSGFQWVQCAEVPVIVKTIPIGGAGLTFNHMRVRGAGRARRPAGLFLTETSSLSPWHVRYNQYNPLEEGAIFRNFADTETNQGGILSFANQYGRLGGSISVGIEILNSNLCGVGERLESWINEILAMRDMVELWDSAQATDRGPLAELIKWDGQNAVRYEKLPRCQAWIATEHQSELLARFAPGDLVGPALYYLQGTINQKIVDHRTSVRLLWNSDHSKMRIHIVPASLIGSMWLQFAKAINGETKYRRCVGCNKWIEHSSGIARSDRKFCSPTCKARSHKSKIAEACQLHTKGVSPKDIARRLETDTKTVKGWIKV